jgi:preprotein translocase SecE subunit
MALKDKKHKGGAPASSSAQPVRSEQAAAVAVSESSASVKEAAEAKKVKAAKPAPVLTKKPSRLRFFVDAFQELRKAHWPSRREAIRLSLLVAAVCFIVGAVLGGIDFVFLKLMGLLLLNG